MIFLWVQNREVDRREIMPIHFFYTNNSELNLSRTTIHDSVGLRRCQSS